ncbi:MAG: hypothetical protein AB1724_01995 [Thermodesulfobacteriota bacterium]
MINWILDNKEWVFSGFGVTVVAGILVTAVRLVRKDLTEGGAGKTSISITNHNIMSNEGKVAGTTTVHDIDILKAKTHILFIDDDQKFKVVDILVKSGWVHTRRMSDVGSIDDEKIQKAQILFIDIQGVGRKLQFRDEGLGLASAVKDKFPNKKVVIYSAQTQGERFHDALRKADDFLPKNADPYEFQQLTERLASELSIEP